MQQGQQFLTEQRERKSPAPRGYVAGCLHSEDGQPAQAGLGSSAGFVCGIQQQFADLVRGIWAVVTGKSGDYTTGTYTFKDPSTGTKIRVTVTADATGRKVVTIGDLT